MYTPRRGLGCTTEFLGVEGNSSREGGKKMSDPSAAGVVPQILFAGISMIIAASPTFARLIHDNII